MVSGGLVQIDARLLTRNKNMTQIKHDIEYEYKESEIALAN